MNFMMKLPQLFGYWCLLCLAPLPTLYFIFHYFSSVQHIKTLSERIEAVHVRKEQSQSIEKLQHSLLSSLSQSDPFYIDKHLESLTFLESEMKKLQVLCAESIADETLIKRMQFLKEGENRLLFSEEKINTKDKLREVVEKQQHPVEIDEEDLKKLLCLIEGMTIWPYGPKEGRPQLLFQDFTLLKNRTHAQDRVFNINMTLIKRENSNNQEVLP